MVPYSQLHNCQIRIHQYFCTIESHQVKPGWGGGGGEGLISGIVTFLLNDRYRPMNGMWARGLLLSDGQNSRSKA